MLAAIIACTAALVIIGVFAVAHFIDRRDAKPRQMTVMKLPNERAQIIGDGAWR